MQKTLYTLKLKIYVKCAYMVHLCELLLVFEVCNTVFYALDSINKQTAVLER